MFSIITICKGRLEHLKQTLPSMMYQFNNQMQFRNDYELIVVDYGCPDKTFSYVIQFFQTRKDLSIKSILVKNQTEQWNPGRCRNIGANQAKGDYFFFVDADMILQPLALLQVEKIIIQKNPILIKKSNHLVNGDKMGTCIIHSKEFHEIKGYNETGIGWCFEDIDIYNRLEKYQKTYNYEESEIKITPIYHDWDLRNRFNNIKNFDQNLSTYYNSMCQEKDHVNPNGYGQGKLNIFSSK